MPWSSGPVPHQLIAIWWNRLGFLSYVLVLPTKRYGVFWHLFSKVWCFSTSFYLWGEYWVEYRARNLREGEAQCAQLSNKTFFGRVFLDVKPRGRDIWQMFPIFVALDVAGKGLGTASREPDLRRNDKLERNDWFVLAALTRMYLGKATHA